MVETRKLIPAETLSSLQESYGLTISEARHLPIGADLNTTVFQLNTSSGEQYFLKVRHGEIDIASVLIPKYLSDNGVSNVIAPIPSLKGRLWQTSGEFTYVLFPFIYGKNAYDIPLIQEHWKALGYVLQELHNLPLSVDLKPLIKIEKYSSQSQIRVSHYLNHLENLKVSHPTSDKLRSLLLEKKEQLRLVLEQTEALANQLRWSNSKKVICHADLHAGNLHITPEGKMYVVDWDTLVLAPKERDLMYIGGGLLGNHFPAPKEESLFYSAYGRVEVDSIALSYFRYERIIQDIAEYCNQLFDEPDSYSTEELELSLKYLEANFLFGGTLDKACESGSMLID